MEQKNESLKFQRQTILIPLLFVFVIWSIYWSEITFGWNFNDFGIYPRTLKGFRGVFFSPFIHKNTGHLFSNSIPLFVLSSMLFYFYRKVAVKILFFGGFLTGVFTWLIARDAYHIGASGEIYLLFSFIFFSGIIRKHFRLISVSLIVIFLYGSMVWYIFPTKESISWEGHFSGFTTGLFFAFLYRKRGLTKTKFQFSKTEFDTFFDEDGNFSPPILEEEIPVEITTKLEKE